MLISQSGLVVASLLGSLFATTCVSTPTPHLPTRSIASGIPLRILPLGDSITWGKDSTTGNGYRLTLQNLLTASSGNPVSYIGSMTSGTMPDNHNEGHPGYTISEIAGQAPQDYPLRPNVVLLMAGTNDIVNPQKPDPGMAAAPERLGALIDQCVNGFPGAVVVVATLTPLIDLEWEREREVFDRAILGVVAERADAGRKVLVAGMKVVGPTDISKVDGIHPVDDGYALMAGAWFDAISTAGANGWITAPLPVAAR